LVLLHAAAPTWLVLTDRGEVRDCKCHWWLAVSVQHDLQLLQFMVEGHHVPQVSLRTAIATQHPAIVVLAMCTDH
jgi:hypothetical protein